jgi:(2R)-3-sulfolactate dehydrogenase (NADP+)
VVEVLPPLARESGIALAAIARSHHSGQAGAHCERLAKQGLLAFVFGNTPKAMALWGGTKPVLGTNPIAFAAPMPADLPPLVIDLALSKVARGRVLAAQKAGRPIPEGWALDDGGRPTTDPHAALKGTMIPTGEAKGAALALMVEVMSAALIGSNFSFEASSFLDTEGPPPSVGQTVIAIDAVRISGGAFANRMTLLAAAFDGEPGTRLPGSRRLMLREKAEREGFMLPPALVAEICALAGKP